LLPEVFMAEKPPRTSARAATLRFLGHGKHGKHERPLGGQDDRAVELDSAEAACPSVFSVPSVVPSLEVERGEVASRVQAGAPVD
jgi:hypothetical protein